VFQNLAKFGRRTNSPADTVFKVKHFSNNRVDTTVEFLVRQSTSLRITELREDILEFASGKQAFINSFDVWVVACSHDGSHIEHGTYSGGAGLGYSRASQHQTT
jgi:hypothetical protein